MITPIRSYTVSSIKDIEMMPFLERAQFTLNGRMSPNKRQTTVALSRMNLGNTEIFIHYDFLRTVPRFMMMNEGCRQMMVDEIADLMIYSQRCPNFKGIVIHMDNCFKAEFVKEYKFLYEGGKLASDFIKKLMAKHIVSPMYVKPEEAFELAMKVNTGNEDVVSFLVNWYIRSFFMFDSYLRIALERRCFNPASNHCKVYLENTTHILKEETELNRPGSFYFNVDLIKSTSKDLFGVCYDTEHGWASKDHVEKDKLIITSKVVSLMVHLNTIEKGVKYGNYRDLHSKTTVFECTENQPEYYYDLVDSLTKEGISYIREIKSDTMYRELEQQNKFISNLK